MSWFDFAHNVPKQPMNAEPVNMTPREKMPMQSTSAKAVAVEHPKKPGSNFGEMDQNSISPVKSDDLRKLSGFLAKSPNTPVSSVDINRLADWVEQHSAGAIKESRNLSPVLVEQGIKEATKHQVKASLQEYDPAIIYSVGDKVSYGNRVWIVREASGVANYPPPDTGDINNTWKLVTDGGGRRKTTRRGKKGRGKKSRR